MKFSEKLALAERIKNCTAGELVAATNTLRDSKGETLEQQVRDVLISALFDDDWIETIEDAVK
jgi:hypothetical protein